LKVETWWSVRCVIGLYEVFDRGSVA